MYISSKILVRVEENWEQSFSDSVNLYLHFLQSCKEARNTKSSVSILGEPLVKGILYYIINKLHCCFNGCLSPKAAWFSVTLAGLDLGLGNLPELLHHHWRIVGFLRPHRASGELEESLFLRSRERARLVLHSFSKVL